MRQPRRNSTRSAPPTSSAPPRRRAHRRHAPYFAFWLHRASGVLLALFLPLHFWVLSSAVLGAESLDGYLVLTRHPAAKAAEFGLVFLLAMHLFGGLRIMALEFLTWRAAHKTVAAAVIAAAFAVACGFLLRAF